MATGSAGNARRRATRAAVEVRCCLQTRLQLLAKSPDITEITTPHRIASFMVTAASRSRCCRPRCHCPGRCPSRPWYPPPGPCRGGPDEPLLLPKLPPGRRCCWPGGPEGRGPAPPGRPPLGEGRLPPGPPVRGGPVRGPCGRGVVLGPGPTLHTCGQGWMSCVCAGRQARLGAQESRQRSQERRQRLPPAAAAHPSPTPPRRHPPHCSPSASGSCCWVPRGGRPRLWAGPPLCGAPGPAFLTPLRSMRPRNGRGGVNGGDGRLGRGNRRWGGASGLRVPRKRASNL